MPQEPATPTVQAVLFDYGLVLSGPPDPAAWASMQEITRLPEDKFDQAYWAPRRAYDRGTYTGAEYWAAVGQHAGVQLSPIQVADLIKADNVLWTQVNQPMVDWAARLQDAGTPTGILSNLGDDMMLGVIARLPWLDRFNHLLWSHTVKLAKPELEIYRHSAQSLGVPAPHILFIDDRDENLAAASEVGMQTIPYTHHGTFEKEMMSRGMGKLWLTGRP